jgi:hypothetical protein
MKIKTTIKFHLPPVIMTIKSTNNKYWQGCGEKKNLIHCWWECKLVNHCGKQYGVSLKKLKIDLPCDPAIPFLGIHSKLSESGYTKGTQTPIFIAALFTIAKLWKQLK